MIRPSLIAYLAAALALAAAAPSPVLAQADYPFLSRAYAQVGLGLLDYRLSGALPEGYAAERFAANPFSGRLLVGVHVTGGLAVQYGTLRPAAWMKYHDVNGTPHDRTVYFNAWSLSLRQRVRLSPKLSLHLEGGLANVTRKGFDWLGEVVLPDERYLSGLAGLSVAYAADERWDLFAQATALPAHEGTPAVVHYAAGAQLNFRRLVPRAASLAGGAYFPERTVRLGYGTSAIGFGVNRLLSAQLPVGEDDTEIGLPIFWLGVAEARHTIQASYERQVYRGRKIFALGWGASVTAFQTERRREWVAAASVYPVLNFYFLRRSRLRPYVTWSVVGPTLLSRADVDGEATGPRVTYQDFLGLGAHLGPDGRHNVEAKIEHYSNGNIFNDNVGVAVPVVLSYGWSW